MATTSYTRSPAHAGSWYANDANVLAHELNTWLDSASAAANGSAGVPPPDARTRGIIAPHAGYRYSGRAAGHSYCRLGDALKNDQRRSVARVFLLGPSHHAHLDGCGISGASLCSTPIGDLAVDAQMVAKLHSTGLFERLDQGLDEEEHSLEMQLPYLCACASRAGRGTLSGSAGVCNSPLVVPILVGSIPRSREVAYGRALAPYLDDPANLFIISSDFCHWGKRFGYTPVDRSAPSIAAGIEALDRRGMRILESRDHAAFSDYLAETKNTICGRHPIGVLLAAIAATARPEAYGISFVAYEQSSACATMSDSSVSYASAVLWQR